MPRTRLGRWSVGLNAFFLAAIGISCVLVLGFHALDFNDHWWDVTVAVAFPASIVALIAGVVAVSKYKEQSILVKLSIIVGILTVLFIFLHSLFISD